MVYSIYVCILSSTPCDLPRLRVASHEQNIPDSHIVLSGDHLIEAGSVLYLEVSIDAVVAEALSVWERDNVRIKLKWVLTIHDHRPGRSIKSARRETTVWNSAHYDSRISISVDSANLHFGSLDDIKKHGMKSFGLRQTFSSTSQLHRPPTHHDHLGRERVLIHPRYTRATV